MDLCIKGDDITPFDGMSDRFLPVLRIRDILDPYRYL
jgi:hypothetical protein